MNVSVGLVSATSFRVPSPGLQDTFGRGSLRLPRQSATGDGSHGITRSSGPAPSRTLVRVSATVSPAKAERAQAILEEEDALISLHRAWYPPVQRPVVADRRPVNEEAIRRRRAELAREGVRWFDVSNRRRAVRTAEEMAHHDIDEAMAASSNWTEREERRLDAWWNSLCGNDPAVVEQHLRGVFQSTDTPASPVSVAGGLLDVAVLIPGEHVLPSESVHLVGGDLSIRRASRSHRAQLHRQVVAGLLIAVARQTFAAAPGLTAVRCHALQATHRGRHDDLSAIGVVELSRVDLAVADLNVEAEALLHRYGSGLRWVTHTPDGPLRPLPLDDMPELADLLARLCRNALGESSDDRRPGVSAPA